MKKIKVVIPDGSMQKKIMDLMKKAGLSVIIKDERTKIGKIEGIDWIKSVSFQRPQEIPVYLHNGHFDVAIVGEDWIANWGYEFPVLLKLPIGRGGNKPVKIVLAVKKNSNFKKPEDLPLGCEVATEYDRLVQKFFISLGRNDINVIPSFGNTEHKPKFGSTAIVDVTESGDSIKKNKLKIVTTIMESNTVIVVNPKSFADKGKRPFIDCFVKLISGAYQASKYVMLVANVPKEKINKASKIIGGLKGPSCQPLKGVKSWFALQSFVPRKNEHKIIFDLLQIGVDDIVIIRDIPLIMANQHK
mgnify:CR=1 FL=1